MLFFPGVGASLKSLLKDPDATVRHKATEVLSIIAGMVYKSVNSFYMQDLINPLYQDMVPGRDQCEHNCSQTRLYT